MGCQETQALIDGFVDGELDLVRSIELERHLHDCPVCSAVHQDRATLRAAMRTDALRYRAPAGLAKRVHAALVERDRGEEAPRKWIPGWLVAQWPSAAATAVALVLVAMWWVRPVETPLGREVVESHIRSMMASHLTDVLSTDQHTVKPWFAGKLDFSPPVRDLSAEGFRLIGGRLDYLDHHPVAAVVYGRNQHVINVFVWPVTGADRSMHAAALQGFNTIDAVRSGMAYWLVSDLNRGELEQLGERLIAP